jgi:tellurite resistance protein
MALPIAAPTGEHALARLPLSLFAAAMGILGLGLGWRVAATQGAPAWIGEAILVLGGLAFFAQAAAYLAKWRLYSAAVGDELADPVLASYCGSAAIDVTLIGAALGPHAAIAPTVWAAGALGQLAVALWLALRWLRRPPPLGALVPSMLIPTIGTLVIPATISAGSWQALGWAGAAVGGVSFVVMLPLMLWRLRRGPALPPILQPTLAILMTPPALATLAWLTLDDGRLAPELLLTGGVAVLVVLLLRLPHFARLPFASSWWAFTFPLANLSLAGLRLHPVLGGVLLALTSIVVAVVAARTLARLPTAAFD